jgi:hypothetical protein
MFTGYWYWWHWPTEAFHWYLVQSNRLGGWKVSQNCEFRPGGVLPHYTSLLVKAPYSGRWQFGFPPLMAGSFSWFLWQERAYCLAELQDAAWKICCRRLSAGHWGHSLRRALAGRGCVFIDTRWLSAGSRVKWGLIVHRRYVTEKITHWLQFLVPGFRPITL